MGHSNWRDYCDPLYVLHRANNNERKYRTVRLLLIPYSLTHQRVILSRERAGIVPEIRCGSVDP